MSDHEATVFYSYCISYVYLCVPIASTQIFCDDTEESRFVTCGYIVKKQGKTGTEAQRQRIKRSLCVKVSLPSLVP